MQLLRMRLEREPDEDAIVRSLEEIGKVELSAYLMESFWSTLDTLLKTLLLSTSIFHVFDRSDAQSLLPGQSLDPAWDELVSLPFVMQISWDPFLLLFQPLFRTFLNDRLSKERTPDEVRHLHRAAAKHFLDAKDLPPLAFHHARLSDDADVLIRAAGGTADFVFHTGAYARLKEVLDAVPPTARWDDPMLAVHQGRLYEHDQDLDNALKWYRRAQALFDQHGPDHWRIGIANDIGGILRKTNKTDEAIALYDAVLARLPIDQPSIDRAHFLANRANVFLQRRALAEAEAGYLEAKHAYELNKVAAGLAHVSHGLAQIAKARNQKEEAFRHLLSAFRWARKAENAEVILLIARELGDELIARGKFQFCHRVYEEARAAAETSDAPELMPYLLTNFGFACALLPEPDEEGVAALMAAREMKRRAGIDRDSTLQNLSTLLIRLGKFAQAVPIVREQSEVAAQTGDRKVANDARAKLEELVPAATGSSTAPAVRPPEAEMDVHRQVARGLVIEGRLRAALQQRWPLVREMFADEPSTQDDHSITIGSKMFYLRQARTIFFLLPDPIDVSASLSAESMGDQNFIFELIWPRVVANKPQEEAGQQLAAIWWVRTENTLWIQSFWHEPPTSPDDSFQMAEQKGMLFAFDVDCETWRPAEHPDGCDCGRPEVHEQFRELASALMQAYSSAVPKQRVVIERRLYPVVALAPPPKP